MNMSEADLMDRAEQLRDALAEALGDDHPLTEKAMDIYQAIPQEFDGEARRA